MPQSAHVGRMRLAFDTACPRVRRGCGRRSCKPASPRRRRLLALLAHSSTCRLQFGNGGSPPRAGMARDGGYYTQAGSRGGSLDPSPLKHSSPFAKAARNKYFLRRRGVVRRGLVATSSLVIQMFFSCPLVRDCEAEKCWGDDWCSRQSTTHALLLAHGPALASPNPKPNGVRPPISRQP